MSGLSDIILFNTNHSPAQNNGGNSLTTNQMDNNFVELIDSIVVLNNTDAISDFNPSTTYASNAGINSLVRYAGTIWKFINGTPQAGVTPGSDITVWSASSPNELINKNQYLDKGGANEISAAEIKKISQAGTRFVKRIITSAEILMLNSNPIELVPAVPGFIIVPNHGWVENNFIDLSPMSNSYATNTTITIYNDGADRPILNDTNSLVSAIKRKVLFVFSGVFNDMQTQLIENSALKINVDSGNPTDGDFDIRINIVYQLVPSSDF